MRRPQASFSGVCYLIPENPLPQRCAGEGCCPLSLQLLVEIGGDVGPQLERRAFAIGRPVIGEEGVAGARIHLDRHVLAGGLGAPAQFLALLDGRVLVFFAEHAE